MTLPDDAGIGAAVDAVAPVLGDNPNFTTVQPNLPNGGVIA